MLSGGRAADELLAPLPLDTPLLLAVSGGPDSVALMLLAADWSPRFGKKNISVATVDHGLRANSYEEALQVAKWAQALGFVHHLLRWEGPKPATRLQERAREARYRLLCACAKEIDPDCAIATAHHADDQAETILFRLLRGSGVAGLSGMASASMRDGVKLLRPLLGVRKSELEAICAEAGHAFVRDPSNENQNFARTRLRALITTLDSQGLNAHSLLRLGRRAAQAEEALNWCALRACASGIVARDDSGARFDAFALRSLPREILQRMLALELFQSDGRVPRLDRLERAAQIIERSLRDGVGARITLGGLSIKIDKLEVTLTPAPPRLRGGAKVETKSRPSDDIV
jgi:tRNA(Ile)-lysidine synthase